MSACGCHQDPELVDREDEPCGCYVAYRTFHNELEVTPHLHRCPLHAAAERLADKVEALVIGLDGERGLVELFRRAGITQAADAAEALLNGARALLREIGR